MRVYLARYEIYKNGYEPLKYKPGDVLRLKHHNKHR